jgi:mannose-6-phosphate isomerase-like protein (cupin superfamily)
VIVPAPTATSAAKDTPLAPNSVITVEAITKIAFKELRPGCEKGVLQENARAQTGVFRVQPGSGVPAHLHSRVQDLFIGVTGELEIRYEGQLGNGLFVLKAGGFCSVPPGVRHEVFNRSNTDEAFFLLVHASYRAFNKLPAPFRAIEAALPFLPR